MTATEANYAVVNNTCCDIRLFDAVFADVARGADLPEELADIFSVTRLSGFNADGSDRIIVDFAD